MDDWDKEFASTVEAGQRNLQTASLLSNWCFHAEVVRSGGRGMIEAQTGLPIGHSGVRCKYSEKNTMLTWLLEDAVFDFYMTSCKGCTHRTPVNIPNITQFVKTREEEYERRLHQNEMERKELLVEREKRYEERAILRQQMSFDETFVLDLLDELDTDDLDGDDPRLEQLANLAPETFTHDIIQHLLPVVTIQALPYSSHAARALLGADLSETERFDVAKYLVFSSAESPGAYEYVLENTEKLEDDQFARVVNQFVSLAVSPPPGIFYSSDERADYSNELITKLFELRSTDMNELVHRQFSSSFPDEICQAARCLLALDKSELFLTFARDVFGKLMRRRQLLPNEERESSVIYYLRKVASRCFEHNPCDVDDIIQSYLSDNDDLGAKEAFRVYNSALHFGYDEDAVVGDSQNIAFKRLLWAAVQRPDEYIDEATQFFRHAREKLAELAVKNFDQLIGAATGLSDKYALVQEPSSVDVVPTYLDELDKSSKLSAINSLQGSLTEWAALGAKHRGGTGIDDYLQLYESLPEDQKQMRANMVVHIAKLISDIGSLNQVLSYWYRALMDEETTVRASAVQAWEDIPLRLKNELPDLFYEAYATTLSDSYLVVHQSTVNAIRRRSFPENKIALIKSPLIALIYYYAKREGRRDFVVECIDLFCRSCISDEDIVGKVGAALTELLLDLDERALYHAVDRASYGLTKAPNFLAVVLKALRSDYTRSITIENCLDCIRMATAEQLREVSSQIEAAINDLMPIQQPDFQEVVLLISALVRAEEYETAQRCINKTIETLPDELALRSLKKTAELIATACKIEQAVSSGCEFKNLFEDWRELIKETEPGDEQ